MLETNSDEGREGQQVIVDELDANDEYLDEGEDDQQDHTLDLSRPSDGMSKIQQHLQATIGKSQPTNYEMEEALHSSDGKNRKDNASIEYEPEPSARIEHNNIDGSLQLNIDQEQIIAHQLSQGYPPRQLAKK